MKYSRMNMEAHCMVYRLPFRTPRKGNSSGITFSTSQEPPGRNGASHSSQARPSAMRPIKQTDAVRRKTGFRVVILLLWPEKTGRWQAMQGLKDPPPEPDTHSPTSVRTAAESRRAARATAWKVLKYALKRADEKKLAQVAASLTYTTVLSLVPLLAVVLSLFTAFPLFADFRVALEGFLAGSLMPAVVSENVMSYLNQFAAKASGLTTIGGLALIVTSVMLFRTIDEAFNDIWQVETRRPLRQRILVYWALLSLGPILVGASLWALTVLARESMGLIGDMNGLANLSLSLLPLLLTGSGFSALFLTVPNRSVRWKDALIGGFF